MFRIIVFFVFVAMTTGSCNDESHSSGRNTIYEDADIIGIMVKTWGLRKIYF